jgi:hypothetical protein
MRDRQAYPEVNPRNLGEQLAKLRRQIEYHKAKARHLRGKLYRLHCSLEWKLIQLLAEDKVPQFGMTPEEIQDLLGSRGEEVRVPRLARAIRNLIRQGYCRLRSKPLALIPKPPFNYLVLNARLPEWVDNDPSGATGAFLLDPGSKVLDELKL